MTKLEWDKTGERQFENGIEQVALFVKDNKGAYQKGVAWNGVTKISESPEGGDSEAKYANNGIYLNLIAPEKFNGNISAYTSPEEFDMCDGSAQVMNSGQAVAGLSATAQTRMPFGLAYKTNIGNDTVGTAFGYKLHLVYNATASVSSRDYSTINESPEANELSWDFTTIAVPVPGLRPSAHLIIDSTKAEKENLAKLEEAIYGGDSTESKLPAPAEVIAILSGQAG